MRKMVRLFFAIIVFAVLCGCDKASAPAMQSDYTSMALDSLKNDIDKVPGIKVKLSGSGLLKGDVFMLSQESGSLASMNVDIEPLSGDEKKLITTNCSRSKGQCNITIYGTVEKVNGKCRLVADKIEL
jgi:hypothetical protein